MCPQFLRSLLVVPGAQTSENVSHEIRVLTIAGDSPDPHLRQREHKINLLRPHSGTLLRRLWTLKICFFIYSGPLCFTRKISIVSIHLKKTVFDKDVRTQIYFCDPKENGPPQGHLA